MEKFYYLSGRYDIELTVGDAVMVSYNIWFSQFPLTPWYNKQSKQKFVVSGELFLAAAWSCWSRTSRSSWEGSASSSTPCWSLLKIWSQSRDSPYIQGSWKTTTPEPLSYFLEFDSSAIYWLFSWGKSWIILPWNWHVCWCLRKKAV